MSHRPGVEFGLSSRRSRRARSGGRYNSVKTLVEGTVDHFMGFTFIQTERVGNDGTNDQVIAYTKSGLALGMGEEPRVEVGPNPGKRFSLQIYAEMSLGAVRTEEAKVVQILCLPA